MNHTTTTIILQEQKKLVHKPLLKLLQRGQAMLLLK